MVRTALAVGTRVCGCLLSDPPLPQASHASSPGEAILLGRWAAAVLGLLHDLLARGPCPVEREREREGEGKGEGCGENEEAVRVLVVLECLCVLECLLSDPDDARRLVGHTMVRSPAMLRRFHVTMDMLANGQVQQIVMTWDDVLGRPWAMGAEGSGGEREGGKGGEGGEGAMPLPQLWMRSMAATPVESIAEAGKQVYQQVTLALEEASP